MKKRSWGVMAMFLLVAAGMGTRGQDHSQTQQSQDPREFQLLQVMRDAGRDVAPVYEGWEPQTDGAIRLYFGYMNRNWREELDIPVGETNRFEPGPADRGQPTHFLPRRHKQVFSVMVPKGFSGPLVWALSVRGETERVTASLAPEQQIAVAKDPSSGKAAPTITLSGERTSTPMRARISAMVRERNGASGDTRVTWAKYRGPGEVTFTPASDAAGGAFVTTATFSRAGEYMIQATTDDASTSSEGSSIPGLSCCWASGVIMLNIDGTGGGEKGWPR